MKVIIYGTPQCTFCKQAIALAKQAYGPDVVEYKTLGQDITKEQLFEMCGMEVRTVPQIFVNSDGMTEYVGGYQDLKERIVREGEGQ